MVSLLALALSLAAAPVPLDETSPVVVAVELRSDVRLDRELRREVWSLVTLEPGRPLDPAEIRRSLGNLHAAGRFAEIEAYRRAEPPSPGTEAAAAVTVIFALYPEVVVESVRLVGELGLRRSRLERRVEQREGQPLRDDALLRGVYGLIDLLEENGFLDPSVRLQVELDERRRRAAITYRIEAGERATVAELRFEGDLGPLAEAELREVARLGPGRPFVRRLLAQDEERLEGYLRARGYRRSRVEAAAPETDGGQVRVVHRVELGPLVEVRVVGAELEPLERRDLLPFLGASGYEEATVQEAIRRLRRHYQQRGYFRVQIERRERVTEERIELELELLPGESYVLEEIRFEGNEVFAAERLGPLLATTTRRFPNLRSGRLVDAVLEEDLANLRAHYALNGYAAAQIGPPLIDALGEDERRLALTIPIVEGPQQRVSALQFDGVDQVAPEQLLADLPLELGGPYHPALVEALLDRLRSSYQDLGFQQVVAAADLDWNRARTLVDVTVDILEGPQTRIDRIVVRGTRDTDPVVVRRILGLQSDDPVSRSRLLEAQRNLFRLGLFSSVEVTLAPARPGEERRDVLVRVEEGKRWRLGYGGGFNTEDGIRGILSASYNNLGGRASTLRLDLNASSRDQRYRLLLSDRALRPRGTPLNFSLYYFNEELSDFDSIRYGTQLEALQYLGRLRLGLFFDYRTVELRELDRVVGAALPDDGLPPVDPELQETEISSFTPSLFYDRRNDPLDPTAGFSTGLQLEYAFPLLGAEERFLRLFLQGTGYLDLAPWGVFAGSLRLGGIGASGGAGSSPISERFFAGGRTTHRAYTRDDLGIEGSTIVGGTPIGGDALFLANLDYRFPVFGPVGGILFADWGNVFAELRDLDAGLFRLGAGVGLRYRSPVGPLRLEVGWKLDRQEGESPKVVFVSFGNPF